VAGIVIHMPNPRAEARKLVSAQIAPGGGVYRMVAAGRRRIKAAVQTDNPVDTGLSRSSWHEEEWTNGRDRLVMVLYNNVRYVGFIRRRGTNEPRGTFICQAAQAASPWPMRCCVSCEARRVGALA
jgi:hypothetical protein